MASIFVSPSSTAMASGQGRRAPMRARRGTVGGLSYRIQVEDLEEDCFFAPRLRRGELIMTLNRQHPFFDELLGQPRESKRQMVELMLLAAARAEVRSDGHRAVLAKYRRRWSSVLAAFLS